jgi:hypothetical protein
VEQLKQFDAIYDKMVKSLESFRTGVYNSIQAKNMTAEEFRRIMDKVSLIRSEAHSATVTLTISEQ